MEKNREIIELEDYELKVILIENYLDNYYEAENEDYYDQDNHDPHFLTLKPGVWDEFEFIESDDTYYSLEDHYVDITSIVQRKSDGKFFKGEYTENYCEDPEMFTNKLIEVFPKQIMKTIYE